MAVYSKLYIEIQFTVQCTLYNYCTTVCCTVYYIELYSVLLDYTVHCIKCTVQFSTSVHCSVYYIVLYSVVQCTVYSVRNKALEQQCKSRVYLSAVKAR